MKRNYYQEILPAVSYYLEIHLFAFFSFIFNKELAWFHFLSSVCNTFPPHFSAAPFTHKHLFLKIISLFYCWASWVAQTVKNLPAMQETQVQSLGRKDPLEKVMATHPSILAWRIPYFNQYACW